MVLASFVADLGPLPDAVRYLARLLNCSTRTAATYRDSLVGDGIVDRTANGWLVINEGGFGRWKERAVADFGARGLRFAIDAVPMAALAWMLTTADLRGVAIVFGEAVGKNADRPGTRTDAERAALASVSRRYVIAARKTLSEHDCMVVEKWKSVPFISRDKKLAAVERVFRRVRLPDDPQARRELCKRPTILSKQSKLAAVAAATAGRQRQLVGGRDATLGRWAPSATREQAPSAMAVVFPIAPSEGSAPSPRNAEQAQAQNGERCAPAKRMEDEPITEAAGAGIFDHLAAALRPGADRSKPPFSQQQQPKPVEHLGDLLQPERIAKLRTLAAPVAIAAVLTAGGCYTWTNAPVRVQQQLAAKRDHLGDEAARVLGAAALDDVLRLARKARTKKNPGGWLAEAVRNRIARVRAGLESRPDFAPRRGEPRDHRKREDRARRTATEAAVVAVQAGNARLLLKFEEAGADLDEVAQQVGRSPDELRRLVDDERQARNERFAAARRSTA
ncbi:MAG: hypothetical protein JNK15_16315 [Planctomycetes bacterium]|nr:hypothetical protein [Planctomycetota bacterium]